MQLLIVPEQVAHYELQLSQVQVPGFAMVKSAGQVGTQVLW